jgi:hypothetical protein
MRWHRLKANEKALLTRRFGLSGNEPLKLEQIGTDLGCYETEDAAEDRQSSEHPKPTYRAIASRIPQFLPRNADPWHSLGIIPALMHTRLAAPVSSLYVRLETRRSYPNTPQVAPARAQFSQPLTDTRLA